MLKLKLLSGVLDELLSNFFLPSDAEVINIDKNHDVVWWPYEEVGITSAVMELELIDQDVAEVLLPLSW
eukprot:4853516-Amphidinium_carterae.1